MRLSDRVALVTGAGSGIGRAIALLFADEGARVIVNDVKLDRARDTADALRAAGAEANAVEADVADSGAVTAMFAGIARDFGRLDVLVNNAGIAGGDARSREELARTFETRLGELMTGEGIKTHWHVTESMTDDAWRRMLAVHLDGTFFCTRAALKLMRAGGAIVNIASVAGLMGLDAAPHYSAAKAGILGFTRAVALEVASRGIRVNAICPGYIDTPMTQPISPLMQRAIVARTPLHRMGDPREVATTALFLASDEAAYFTGQWLSPNGGLFIG